MPINAHLDDHLAKSIGRAGFSTSGATATIPAATVSADRLHALLDVAAVTGQEVSLVAGVLTIKPR